MKYPISSIWHDAPDNQALDNFEELLSACIERGLVLRKDMCPVKVFFRADDIGVPGRQFSWLMELFSKFEVPLALAVVPVWITQKRWEIIRETTSSHAALWCWHQHGWRHANHEIKGKKQEFGPHRSIDALKYDLMRGNNRLESILGDDYFKAFTPPWNRCGQACLDLLKAEGYHFISRSRGAHPAASGGLIDIQVNVDPYTLKAPDPYKGWEKLFGELEKGISEGLCGIMIHHQRMNQNAFSFLEILIKILINTSHVQFINLKTITDSILF